MKQQVTLSMIVKNEAHVIERCLESVKQFITGWVIVDTGSTDGTQQKIRECMSRIPGNLHERPWRDFGHNRTEALELAKCVEYGEYALVIDADD
jgi:glycosyltransferase involved in cell wall biosynthesis